MKKSIIAVMVTITLIFCSFVCGFYVGRNQHVGTVEIRGFDTVTTTVPNTKDTATTTVPNSTATVITTVPSTIVTAPTAPTITTEPPPTTTGLININSATLEELDTLPGIGPKLAQAIIDYRTEYGDFEVPEDLIHVPGIGEKKLSAILDLITTGG